jgi:hypothetical protein
MPEVIDTTAWSAALLGLVALFAAIGALRKQGAWQTMIGEIEKSPALQLVSGFMEMTAGAAIYLANPWVPADVLACVMKAIGGLMMVEALMVLGFSDLYFQFWLKNLSAMQRGWAAVTLVAGLVLAVGGMIRFH